MMTAGKKTHPLAGGHSWRRGGERPLWFPLMRGRTRTKMVMERSYRRKGKKNEGDERGVGFEEIASTCRKEGRKGR